MITWIQTTFQHHFRTIFMVMLAVIIISFVFISGVSNGLGRAAPKTIDRYFFDLNLNNLEDQERFSGDAAISLYLRAGYDLPGSQLSQYAAFRYANLYLANELKLPAPNEEQIKTHLATLRAFAGPDGKFDPKRFADYRDRLKTNPKINEGDVSRVISDDIRLEQVEKLLAGPGYVLPTEVNLELQRTETTWTLTTLELDYAAFKPTIEPTDAELSGFFEQNPRAYDFPEQVVLDYVDFPATDYVANVTLTDADIRAYYDANPARFPKPPTPPAAPDPKIPSLLAATPATGPDVDFAAVRSQVEAALRLDRARRLATTTAADFSVELYEEKITPQTLDAVLAKRQWVRKSLSAFAQDKLPAELGSSEQTLAEAFKLNAERALSDVVTTGRGAAILVFKEKIPARTPALAEVKDKVLTDYRDNERRKLFTDAGRLVQEKLTARLLAGDKLPAAVSALEATLPKVTTKDLPAFTRRQPPQGLDGSVMDALDKLQAGEVSPMTLTGDKGRLVYVVEKKLPVLEASNAKVIETRTQLASMTASRSGGELLNSLIEKETARNKLTEP